MSGVPFEWTVQLQGLVIKDGYKVKYLRIKREREYWVKVPKALRAMLDPALVPGTEIVVSGWASRCHKTGKLDLVAEQVRALAARGAEEMARPNGTGPGAERDRLQGKVRVCLGSSCRQRGARAVCDAIRAASDTVVVQPTGCFKACKRGPNLVLPDRTCHSGVTPEQVVALFGAELAAEGDRTATAQP